MYTIYRINADDLDSRFLKALKALFKNKEIEIAVCETAQGENDETAYLLQSPANRERLLKAIETVSSGDNLVTVQLDNVQ